MLFISGDSDTLLMPSRPKEPELGMVSYELLLTITVIVGADPTSS